MTLAGAPIEDPESTWTQFLEDYGGDVSSLSDAQSVLLRHIVDSWVDHGSVANLGDAINSALQTDSNVLAVQMLLKSWARTDPSIAFRATTSIDNSETRTEMQQAIMTAWISVDPLAVLDAMEIVPAELQDWSKQEVLIALSATTPTEAVKRLGIISNAGIKGSTAQEIVTNWAKVDPEATRDWVLTDPDIQGFRRGLMYRLVREVAKADPELAMKWALEEPTSERLRGRGLEQDVVWAVASQGNFETAMLLAAQARDIENKQWSYTRVGNALVARGKIDDALNLLKEIPERYHNIYQEQVIANWVYSEPDVAFERLESFDSQGIREDVAAFLFYNNSSTKMLSKEQVRSLKDDLPEMLQGHVE